MNTLIVYSTKSGASRECAELLAAKIKDCTICDLARQEPSIESFDMLILGSGVRMGKLYKPMKNFIDKNKKAILSKKTAFFLCNSYPDTFQKIIEKNISKEHVENAVCIESFGGIPPFTVPKNQDWILMDHVNHLVQAITAQ
ncbi:flavodoxin domain-containing protein [Kineothrix sedimenti]|uniref:Flavodoxin domain-containing protein n=1 Tax=Kineothrix sedimenti TaxID=3123317 RepID=A0ABZ3F1B2_9FIRM